jgi:hypothetical protein
VHCALQWVSVWRGHNIAIVLRVCASRTKRGFKRASCARIDIPYDNMQHATRSLSETMVIVLDVKTTAEVLMVSTTRDSPSQIQCMREKPGVVVERSSDTMSSHALIISCHGLTLEFIFFSVVSSSASLHLRHSSRSKPQASVKSNCSVQ